MSRKTVQNITFGSKVQKFLTFRKDVSFLVYSFFQTVNGIIQVHVWNFDSFSAPYYDDLPYILHSFFFLNNDATPDDVYYEIVERIQLY